MQEWVAIFISTIIMSVIIITAIVKLQNSLFEKMSAMTKALLDSHSKDSEAHPDIRSAIRSQKHYLEEYEKEQSLRWKEHDKWSQSALNELLAEIRNHKA